MKDLMLSSPNVVVDAVREGVNAFRSSESPSLAESLVRLYGAVLKIMMPARRVIAVIDQATIKETIALSADEQAHIVRFFNSLRDFDEALAAVDVGVVDVYQPGLIPALVSVTGFDYDIHYYFNQKLAPKFGLDASLLPSNLVHFLANYSGEYGYQSESQISTMKSDVLGGGNSEWYRYREDSEETVSPFAFREEVTISKAQIERLSLLCNSFLEVRSVLSKTIQENWTLADLAKTKQMSVEVVMGDKFENIHQSTVINRSIVSEAMNTVSASNGPEIAQALEAVAEAIEESKSVAGGALFDSFSKELQKEQPHKRVLQELWEGLTKVVPSVASLAEAGVKIATLFT